MHAILAAAGIVDGGDGEPTFRRGDGSEARVESQAKIYEDVRLTPEDPSSCRSRAGTTSRTPRA